MPDQSDFPDDLAREIKRLRRELERADRDRSRLERERDRLQRENERLQQELDRARRAAKRAAAPFSKGPPKRHPRRPGRRAGRDYGRHGQRARPAPIDDVIPVGLPAACPHCAGAVEMTRVAAQYQEELPEVRPLVRRFDVAIGRCRPCGRRLQGRHPLQTSNALGAAGVQLGPQAVALMVQLNKQLGLSHGKIATLLRDRFAVAVTSSTVTRALHRAARQARPTYVALCETIRGSPVVVPDETSWRVNGHGHWLWAFATPETTVYAIQPGRGFAQAAGILGAEYAGVLVRDGWAPYRQFTAAAHQTCLAHLLRRCRDLRQDHPRAQFARRVQAALQQALRIRDRRDAGTISRHGAAVARGHVTTRVHTALDHVGPLPAMRRFAAHLSVELPALFSFLFDPAVDATNWRAEQALRPAVVNRKVVGWQSHRPGRRHPTGPHQCPPYGAATPPGRFRNPRRPPFRAPQPTGSHHLVSRPETSPR